VVWRGGLLDHLEGGGVVVGPGEGGVHVVCGVPVLLPQQQVVTSTVHLYREGVGVARGRVGQVRGPGVVARTCTRMG